MIRKLSLLLLFILLLLPVVGCWSRRELNDLAIVVGMGIDKKDNIYKVSIQIVNPEQLVGTKAIGDRPPVTVFESSAVSVSEALRDVITKISRKPYFSHLRLLTIGENLAREGIGQTLDFVSRNQEFRSDFAIVIIKGGEAKDALLVLTPLEKIPANKLFLSLQKSQDEWAPTRLTAIDELINDLIIEGKQPVVAGAMDIGSKQAPDTNKIIQHIEPTNVVKFVGLSVFKGDKLIGWLNKEDSKGYNYILNHVHQTVGHIDCPRGGTLSLESLRTNAKIKATVIRGTPRIHVDLEGESNIVEVNCHIDLTKPENIREIEEISSQTLKERMEGVIHKVQRKYKSDIFGFGEAIYRAHPNVWSKLSKDWDDHFANLEVDVSVAIKVRRSGTVSNSFTNEIKKE
jgi:spore germination protein KC